jgi:hypothetical protein
MGQIIGAIIFALLALLAITAILYFMFGSLGMFLAPLQLLAKLAGFGGALYLVWRLFRKYERSD